MKDVMLTAIILIIVGLSVRSCRWSFNHDFVPDELTSYSETPKPSYVHLRAGGYYAIRSATSTDRQSIWLVESNNIEMERIIKVKKQLPKASFEVLDFSEQKTFGVVDGHLPLDSLIWAIREIDGRW